MEMLHLNCSVCETRIGYVVIATKWGKIHSQNKFKSYVGCRLLHAMLKIEVIPNKMLYDNSSFSTNVLTRHHFCKKHNY